MREDEANELCIRMIDQMLGSLEDIEEFAGLTPAHKAMKTKFEEHKFGFEFETLTHYSCLKWNGEEFAKLFYGEITDALLTSVEKEKIDVYKKKEYTPAADHKLVMSNLMSEYMATAYDIKDAKK